MGLFLTDPAAVPLRCDYPHDGLRVKRGDTEVVGGRTLFPLFRC